MKIAKKFTVIGRVQGVGYRYFTQHIANKIGCYGYVKNLYNGNVEVYAIGAKEQLIKFKELLYKGTSFSHVENVVEEDMNFDSSYINFIITH
jgi:acylphosphatase